MGRTGAQLVVSGRDNGGGQWQMVMVMATATATAVRPTGLDDISCQCRSAPACNVGGMLPGFGVGFQTGLAEMGSGGAVR